MKSLFSCTCTPADECISMFSNIKIILLKYRIFLFYLIIFLNVECKLITPFDV